MHRKTEDEDAFTCNTTVLDCEMTVTHVVVTKKNRLAAENLQVYKGRTPLA
jgi:hypothetical protein